MIAGSLILFLVGGLFLVLAIFIYRGKTKLIHDYHQTRVKDKKAYGRAMGKALSVMAASMLVGGVLALLIGEGPCAWLCPVTVSLGFLVGLVMIVIVQKKYNQGIF